MKISHVVLIASTLVLTPVLYSVSSYIGAANDGNRWEVNVQKFNDESRNTLAAYTTSVMEMAQVPKMYEESLRNVIQDTFEGRYGADGSRATMQWIQEQNIQFDSSMFSNLQTTMLAGRKEFRLSQTKKIEVCSNYEAELGYVVSGFWLRMAGYPKKDIQSLCKVIVNDHTNKAFESGIDNGINLIKS